MQRHLWYRNFSVLFTSSLSAKQRRARQHATFRTVQGTLRIWRGFVTLALVNCIYLEVKWMNQFECTVHCMQCAVQLNYWEPVWLELIEYTEYKLLETRSAILCSLTQYSWSALPRAKIEAASPPKLDLSPGGLGRGQLTARPARGGRGP